MMQSLPRDPLSRFLDLAQALTAEKRWWEDRTIVRYAALPLVTAAGNTHDLVDRATAAAEAVRQHASWASDLRTSLRFVLAAFVVAGGRDPLSFATACAETRQRFREAGVRRGGPYELVAAAMLHIAGAERDRDVARLQRIYETMKAHHWWLTGPEDLPACALLAVHGDQPAGMPQRIEAIYERLRGEGLRAGDGLQLASHVLYLAPGTPAAVADRFLRLHRGFKAAGIAMWDCDRDELAILCLVDHDAPRMIATVVEHRARIRAGLRHTGPTTGFSYACGTAFLETLAARPFEPDLLKNVTVANLAMATNAASVMQQQRQAAAAST